MNGDDVMLDTPDGLQSGARFGSAVSGRKVENKLINIGEKPNS